MPYPLAGSVSHLPGIRRGTLPTRQQQQRLDINGFDLLPIEEG